MSRPSVSVVIPTIGRPELARAIRSALDQETRVYEVVVALDSDADIAAMLPADPRVRIERVGPGAGGNAARQRGIEVAEGSLVALLDDDDTWRPDKLTLQLDLVGEQAVGAGNWIATSRLVAQRGRSEEIWPSQLMKPGDRLAHYVLRKRALKGGVGFMQASTLLFPKSLAVRIPFDESLRFHQDIDWLISLDEQVQDLRVFQCPEPLTNYAISQNSVSGGTGIDPSESIKWAIRRISNDRRSLGDFVLTTSVIYAARRGSVVEVLRTTSEGLRVGRPGIAAICYAGLRVGTTLVKSIRSRASALLASAASQK